jgi:hypothetical protein
MNWHKATLAQLYVIAFDDPMASTDDRWDALQEILRRQRRRNEPASQVKIKAVYPR